MVNLKCFSLHRSPVLTWLMLHTTTEGKKTSESGAVIVSTVVTTFELRKS